MSAHVSRTEDLLNQHLDALLHGALDTAETVADDLTPELEEMLEVAGLLAESMGALAPDPEARARGLQQLLAAARNQRPTARILLFPTVVHRNGTLPQAAGVAPRRSEGY